jgi:small-conductance mechanosensitive channel
MVDINQWFEDVSGFIGDNPEWNFFVRVLIWVLIAIAIVLIVRPVVRRIFQSTKTDVDDQIIKIVEGPVLLIVFFFGLLHSLEAWEGFPRDLLHDLEWVYRFTVSLVVVYLAYRIYRSVFIPLLKESSKKRGRSFQSMAIPAFDLLGATVIVVVGLFWVATRMGVNVTVFIASLGVAGLVLAFAMQDTLSNFFSGLHLMFDRPFDIGDTLEIDGDFLEVLQIGFRSTRLYNIFAYEVVIMPNNMVANQKIINITKPDTEYRSRVDVGVAYGSPVKKVTEILLEATNAHPDIIHDDPEKEPRVRFTDFGDSALQFRLLYSIRDVLEQWKVATAVREHIDRRFREEGITIPFPQRTVSFLGQKDGQELNVAMVGQEAAARVPA